MTTDIFDPAPAQLGMCLQQTDEEIQAEIEDEEAREEAVFYDTEFSDIDDEPGFVSDVEADTDEDRDRVRHARACLGSTNGRYKSLRWEGRLEAERIARAERLKRDAGLAAEAWAKLDERLRMQEVDSTCATRRAIFDLVLSGHIAIGCGRPVLRGSVINGFVEEILRVIEMTRERFEFSTRDIPDTELCEEEGVIVPTEGLNTDLAATLLMTAAVDGYSVPPASLSVGEALGDGCPACGSSPGPGVEGGDSVLGDGTPVGECI